MVVSNALSDNHKLRFMPSKEWVVAPPATSEQLLQYRGMSSVLAQILINRGFDDPQAANHFLYDRKVNFSPFNMPDMSKATGRIRTAIKNREPIAVYGDFDADGVTSTTLLVEALRQLGANVRPYIPHRVDEGYGLNTPALKKLAEDKIKLVITVDCGIRSIEEVIEGQAAGLDIIITDHHSLGPELPDTYAVVNCKREGYQENMLAGVGVAFKLVQALIMAERKNNSSRNGKYAIDLDPLYDLVAIGTVADLMPLNRLENRVLVRRGLEVLNQAKRPGIRALLEVSGIEPGNITASTIGFSLGPRINAAGRLDNAILAYNLLSSRNMTDAMRWAEKLQELNTLRQSITRETQNLISQQLEDESKTGDIPLIFTGHSSFQPGIVGLVAGRIAEEYFRPTIVMEQGETESRASCRSIPQFDITNALDQCADLLVRHGGHALAAGFTVMNENIPALKERMTNLAKESLDGQVLTPTLNIDMEIDIHALTETLYDELLALEPCGNGNEYPTFAVRNVHVADYRTVGKDNRHLKFRISRASQPPLDAIGFGLGDWAKDMPERIDMAFQLEINEWNGRKTLQANVQDIAPAIT